MRPQAAPLLADIRLSAVAAIPPSFVGIPLAVAAMSAHHRLRHLALRGGPIARHSAFLPNSGIGVPRYPPNVAPQPAILQHFVAAARAGKGLILKLADAQAIAAAQRLPFHASPVFLTWKDGAPLMRLVDDYSAAGPNHPDKKAHLAHHWAAIANPGPADICAALSNALAIHGAHRVIGCRLDAADAYHRIRTRPRDVPLMALAFFDGAEALVYLPLTNEFGSQDSNYQWAIPAAALIAPVLQRDYLRHGCYMSSVYTDDFWHFDDAAGCDEFEADFTAHANATIGLDAVKPSKTIKAKALALHGYFVDCADGTIGVTERIYARFLAMLLDDVPREPAAGAAIPLAIVQALASYSFHCAALMPFMQAFRKCFSFNTRRSHIRGATAFLTARSIRAVWTWRSALLAALQYPSLLCVPISVPLLLRRLPGEDRVMRAARHAGDAVCVGYADACTDGHGLGGYIPARGWFSTAAPEIRTYWRADGALSAVDINPLEFLAVLLLAEIMVQLHPPPPGTAPPHRHFHIWCDNSSTVAWATNSSAAHPLHLFITQALVRLQATTNSTFTFGSIAGALNIHADAASRNFDCPNGAALRAFLAPLPRLSSSAALLSGATAASQTMSPPTSPAVPGPPTARGTADC